MVLFVEAVKAAVRFTRCQLLNAEAFVAGGAGLLPSGSRNSLLDAVNRQRRLLGCTGPDIEAPDPEFFGGQCPGVSYRVDYQNRTTAGDFGSPNFRTGLGPFSGATKTVTGVSASINLNFANTSPQILSGPAAEVLLPRILSVTRLDGLPDDCGSIDPIFPPPTNIDIDIDIDYDDDDGNPINITIPFIFAPIKVNFDGSLEIPFSFDFGGFTFDGSLDLSPEFDIDINIPPIGRGVGNDFTPGPEEEEVDPEVGPEKIIGLVVTATAIAPNGPTGISTANIPDLFVPRLGSVKFAYSLGAATFWSNDIDVKGRRVFIPCPFSQGADAAAASPVPGVSLSFIEIRGYPLATTRDILRSA